ncbi:MAG: hypothetical protein ACI9VS_001042 [Candidatus Binatia bacterium]|jgi:hypothetical protein
MKTPTPFKLVIAILIIITGYALAEIKIETLPKQGKLGTTTVFKFGSTNDFTVETILKGQFIEFETSDGEEIQFTSGDIDRAFWSDENYQKISEFSIGVTGYYIRLKPYQPQPDRRQFAVFFGLEEIPREAINRLILDK